MKTMWAVHMTRVKHRMTWAIFRSPDRVVWHPVAYFLYREDMLNFAWNTLNLPHMRELDKDFQLTDTYYTRNIT